MLTPDIIVDLKFYKTEDGGRKTPTDSIIFGCIFVVGNDKHDCRLLLEKIGSIAPGESKAKVPIKFLCAELVLPKLDQGSKFYLWDMRNIAEGTVVRIVKQQHEIGLLDIQGRIVTLRKHHQAASSILSAKISGTLFCVGFDKIGGGQCVACGGV